LVGYNSVELDIRNSYSYSIAPSRHWANNVFRVWGGSSGRRTITSAYFFSDLWSSIGESDAVRIRDRSTFVDWDFDNIWEMNPNINCGVPYLRALEGSYEYGRVWSDWSEWNTAKAATCEAPGSRERTRFCTRCGETDNETREIPQLTELDGCDPISIRDRQNPISPFGILLENAIVSDIAKISVITPETATINVRVLDNLGNFVFQTSGRSTDVFAWNLTNAAGRFVGNGTYLVVVEATGISGKRYLYSARIGVSR